MVYRLFGNSRIIMLGNSVILYANHTFAAVCHLGNDDCLFRLCILRIQNDYGCCTQ